MTCNSTTYLEAISDSEAWKQIGLSILQLPFLPILLSIGYCALVWCITWKCRPQRLTVNMLIWVSGIVAASFNGHNLITMFMESHMTQIGVGEILLNLLNVIFLHIFLISFIITFYQRKTFKLKASPEERLDSKIIVILTTVVFFLFVVTWHVFQQKAPLGCVGNFEFILNQMMMLMILINHSWGIWLVANFMRALLAKSFVSSTLEDDKEPENGTMKKERMVLTEDVEFEEEEKTSKKDPNNI